MSPNCSHGHMVKMPSGVIKCGDCNAIDAGSYGSWWPDVFPWAKEQQLKNIEKLREQKRGNIFARFYQAFGKVVQILT